ncbi:MAG: sensor histidine kinase [Flavisolibacter sp.]|nr:sensor histidine kinase [Flavisolibacter sp.]
MAITFSYGQTAFSIIKDEETVVLPQEKLKWFPDSISAFNNQINIRSHINLSTKDHHWSRFTLVNNTDSDKEYFLQIPKTGFIHCWVKRASDPTWEYYTSGSLLPLQQRSLASNSNGIKVVLLKEDFTDIVLQLQPVFSIYRQDKYELKVQRLAHFERQDSRRLLWQGIFLGIILVMTLYNLILFFAVKDVSYFYFVLSLVGIGLYFSFYYGIGIEYLWPNAPLWDTYCYTFIVPFSGLARILFTKTYLHSQKLLPGIDRVLNVLGVICVLCISFGFISYILQIDILRSYITVVGVLGTSVMIMMLVSGTVAYYKENYKPAQYFIYANALLVVGGILFIFREMGYFPDNFYTRYFVQVATLIQVIMFALGLASRLNETRFQLAEEIVAKERLALQNEKEKKQLIEQQKTELESRVHQQTLDLKQQNAQLESTINQLKHSEIKLTQLNQLKDKFFSIISHDLRNPLATMQSTLKLITEHHNKLNEEEKQKLVIEAQASLDNLNQLLYNLLQWSQSQMNLLEFKPEKIKIKSIIEDAVKVSHLNAHMKNIKILVAVDETSYAYADKNMIEFVVRNLISNAIKFSHRNHDVYVTAFKKNNIITIEVKDSGIGLSESKMKKLIDTNSTITKRGTEKEKGSGLGLLISKEFIEKNNGKLSIQSVAGKGSCFSFTIPEADIPDMKKEAALISSNTSSLS